MAQHLSLKFFQNNTHSPFHHRSTPIVSMASFQVDTFLQQQTTEYQHHLNNKNKVTKILQYQHNIQTYRSIPKHYFPLKTPETLTEETTLTKEFQDQYEQLFFQHLNKIILHNTITLELETARLEAIVSHVEQHLATLNLPSHTLSQLYHQFLSKNNITNHTIPSQLRQLLPTDTILTKKEPTSSSKTTTTKPTNSSTTHTAAPTHQRKRKRGIQRHPATKKQQRWNSFLAKHPSVTTPLT